MSRRLPTEHAFRLRSGQARAGLLIVASIVIAALTAPWWLPWDPATQELANRLQGPTWQHWFGLDELGRDILARVLLGARVSLLVGFVVVGGSSAMMINDAGLASFMRVMSAVRPLGIEAAV